MFIFLSELLDEPFLKRQLEDNIYFYITAQTPTESILAGFWWNLKEVLNIRSVNYNNEYDRQHEIQYLYLITFRVGFTYKALTINS